MNSTPPIPASDSFAPFLLASWKSVVIVAFLGAVAGVATSFLLQKMYRSEAVVVPAPSRDARGALADSLGGLSGLASLAGINVLGETNARDADLEYLKSRELLRRFMKRHTILPTLYPSRWDATAHAWKGEAPTEDAAVARLQAHVVSILQDRQTGSVTVAVILRDPKLAAEWANLLITDANSDLRAGAQLEAQKSIDFLNGQLKTTTLVGVEQAIYRLIENQINSIMLMSVSSDYAFRIVDPAAPSDPSRYASPNRMLMGMLGGLLGGAIMIAMLYIRLIRNGQSP
jgi:uncharacterized protein involved in exopolysaccharide biosynthesis